MYEMQNDDSDCILPADVRKGQIPAIKKEAALKKEEKDGAVLPEIKSEESTGHVKEESKGEIGRAPDAAQLIQEDLSTFDTRMPAETESKTPGSLKKEKGVQEGKISSPHSKLAADGHSSQPPGDVSKSKSTGKLFSQI